MRMFRYLLLACALCLPLAAQGQDENDDKFTCRIIYVPTDQVVVDKMLDMAKVKKGDVVFDLGSGDGRIVCTAVKKYGARGIGVDIDPARIKDSLETMKKFGLTKDEVEFRQGDALRVKDLEKADVITLYMLPEFMEKLEPQLKRLRPGTRVVAHDYPFPNVAPDQVVEFPVEGSDRPRYLYLWVVKGEKK